MTRHLLTITAAIAGALAATSAASPADAQSRRTPQGSYTQSCSQITFQNGRLSAQCQDMRNGTRRSTLETPRCGRADISNDNGILVCGSTRGVEDRHRPDRDGPDRGGPDRDGPGRDRPGLSGPGRGWSGPSGEPGTLTIYRDADFNGRSWPLTGGIANLSILGMNDAVSSIRVGRGDRWEVCEDANFRGRCEILSGDVRDLRSLRLNDAISSVRPIDRR